MIDILIQFVLATFATFGFAIIFRVPKRNIPVCVLGGAMGWITMHITVSYLGSAVMGCFMGACVVGLLSTLFSRIMKEASTIFVIPGILCLVPGSYIFRTMEALLLKNLRAAAEIGLQTLFMAGAIAIGLLVIGAVIGVIRSIVKRTVALGNKL